MKDIHEVGKKMTKNSQKMVIYESLIFKIFSFKTENQGTLCHKFSSNDDLDMFGTSKCLSELYFCES